MSEKNADEFGDAIGRPIMVEKQFDETAADQAGAGRWFALRSKLFKWLVHPKINRVAPHSFLALVPAFVGGLMIAAVFDIPRNGVFGISMLALSVGLVWFGLMALFYGSFVVKDALAKLWWGTAEPVILPKQPLRILSRFMRWFKLTIGCLAFAGLFSSSMPMAEKVFFGAVFLLLVGLHDFKEMTDEFQREQLSRLTWFQFRMLSKTSNVEPGDHQIAFDEYLRHEQFEADMTDGEYEALQILMKYLIWLVVGWLLGSQNGLQVFRGLT